MFTKSQSRDDVSLVSISCNMGTSYTIDIYFCGVILTFTNAVATKWFHMFARSWPVASMYYSTYPALQLFLHPQLAAKEV